MTACSPVLGAVAARKVFGEHGRVRDADGAHTPLLLMQVSKRKQFHYSPLPRFGSHTRAFRLIHCSEQTRETATPLREGKTGRGKK